MVAKQLGQEKQEPARNMMVPHSQMGASVVTTGAMAEKDAEEAGASAEVATGAEEITGVGPVG